MRPRIKRIIPIVALLLLCSTLFVSIGGCLKKDDGTFCTDLFSCMYNEDKTGVIILELTEKGQEQEILVIPEEINGLPVVQLGGTIKGYPYQIKRMLSSEKVKKIYFLLDAEEWKPVFTNLKCSQRVDIVLKNNLRGSFCPKGSGCDNHFFSMIENESEEYGRYTIEKCNIIFYSEDKVYWFDIINENDYHILPIDPQREGYDFLGWYLDKEYTVSWDKQFVMPEGKIELNLYAKWSEA